MGEISEALRRAGSETGRRPKSKPLAQANPPREPREKSKLRLRPTDASAARSLAVEPKPSLEVQSFSRALDETAPARACLLDPTCPAALSYRRTALRIRALTDERSICSLVLTSALPQEGKTTIACNLAIELARLDESRQIVLVDMDLRRPTVGRSLGLESDRAGLEALLMGDASIDDCAIATEIPNLDVICVRDAVREPAGTLTSDRVERTLRQLESRYPLVLIDTPPLVVGSDASLILRQSDAGVLVAVSASTPVRKIRFAADEIPPNKLIATLLNFAPEADHHVKYASYYHAASEDDGVVKDAESRVNLQSHR